MSPKTNGYLALDNRSAFSTRVLIAGNEAFGAWVRAVVVARRSSLPARKALEIAPRRIWRALEKASLATRTESGWRLETNGLAKLVIGQTLAERLRREARPMRGVVFARDGFACRYCGAGDVPLTIDHLVPLTKGGTNADENLVTACGPCNSRKGAKTLEQAGMVLR